LKPLAPDQSVNDNYAATFGTIFASGVGNGGPPNSPATCYNGMGVAAFGGASSVGPTLDGRSKPDITAPANVTSYSTPLVTGGASIVVQAAGTTANGNDPRTVKALLLNGAIKPRYQAADFLGKAKMIKRSWGYSAGKRSSNYSEHD
jgi:Subtilase family